MQIQDLNLEIAASLNVRFKPILWNKHETNCKIPYKHLKVLSLVQFWHLLKTTKLSWSVHEQHAVHWILLTLFSIHNTYYTTHEKHNRKQYNQNELQVGNR